MTMLNLFDAYSSVLHAGTIQPGFQTFGRDPAVLRERAGEARADTLRRGLAAIGAAWKRYRAAAESRQATRALSHLDDRMLSDIGISRAEIPYLVIHGPQGRRAANDDRPLVLAGCG